MTKPIRIEQPYTNEFGTYNPGDTITVVTMCTQRVSMYKARYLGYIERAGWRGAVDKFVQAEVDEVSHEIQYPDGTPFSWSTFGNNYDLFHKMMDDGRLLRVAKPYKRITTLQRNRIAPTL